MSGSLHDGSVRAQVEEEEEIRLFDNRATEEEYQARLQEDSDDEGAFEGFEVENDEWSVGSGLFDEGSG